MGGSRRNLLQIAFVQRDLPIGSIQLYSGAVVDIPSTWRLCDGTFGTPDLRNKFVAGAGDTYAVDATGGAINHLHDFTSNTHSHDIIVDTDMGVWPTFNYESSMEVATGTTDNANGLPPYLALAYIMYAGKLK